jgi:hypothetical protein
MLANFILFYTISPKFEEKGWMKKLDGGVGWGKLQHGWTESELLFFFTLKPKTLRLKKKKG